MTTAIDPARLRTVHLVPLTAFGPDGALNLPAQREHLASMYAAGFRAFLPAAGSSEFHSLAPGEIIELVRVTRKATGDDALVFAPVGGPIGVAIETAQRAAEAGCDGVMFMPLTHPYLSDAGALRYYEAVLDAVALPAVIYKTAAIPGDPLLVRLAGYEAVVGFKYAVNDLEAVQKVVDAAKGMVEVICGSAERFAPYFLLAGASGYTTGAGNLCPNLTLALHRAIRTGQWEEAMRLQRIILPIELYRAREGGSFNIAMLKCGIARLGRDFGPARPPQRLITPAEEREIAALLDPILAEERRLAG